MDLKTLEKNLAANTTHLHTALVADIKAEGKHIADPTQCGSIVRRHFDALTMSLLFLVALFVGGAALIVRLYSRR